MKPKEYNIMVVSADQSETALLRNELLNLENGSTFRLSYADRLDEALTRASRDSFHLMMVDLVLPDSRGLGTFVKMRNRAASIPTVVMVESKDRALAMEASRNGALDYLVKGEWNGQVLERAIRHSLERQRLTAKVSQAHEELLECQNKFRAFFESSPEPMYMKNEHLELIAVNPAMAKLFDTKPEKLVGTDDEKLFGKDAARRIERLDRQVLEGDSVEETHTRVVNGIPITFLDTRVPLRNARNEVIGVCCTSRIVSERQVVGTPTAIEERQHLSEATRKSMEQATRVAATDGTVLLLGESGTGKDYLSRWIHDNSDRAGRPYFSLNCAALSPELAESELFGHESGAFTGARGRKRGMLELAEGGTLLLNEIGELPLSLQSKLLAFLDSRTFLRVGGEMSIAVDARLMAASHRNLEEEVAERKFLEPLFHRLNVFTLRLPPLRERIEDLPLLVESLMTELAVKMQLDKLPVLDKGLLDGLSAYDWPGNVRELKNTLERALMLWDGGRFDLKLSYHSISDAEKWSRDLPYPSSWTLKDITNDVTKRMCMQALHRAKGNKKEAARMMGTSRDALYRFIKRYGIDVDQLI